MPVMQEQSPAMCRMYGMPVMQAPSADVEAASCLWFY